MKVTGGYNNVYENVYAKKGQEAVKKEEREDTTRSNEEYLNMLQKKFPDMELSIGYGISAKDEGNKNLYALSINPGLLEKMQNDPEAEKEYTQRIRDIKAAMDWLVSYDKARGGTTYYKWVNNYIDENGKYYHSCMVIHTDEVNEELRKKAEENTKKLIEKTRENTKKKKKELQESMEEKAKQMIEEKRKKAEDGKLFLYNSDVEALVAAAKEKEEGSGKSAEDITGARVIGSNLDKRV